MKNIRLISGLLGLASSFCKCIAYLTHSSTIKNGARAITPKTGKTWLETSWVQIQKYRRSYLVWIVFPKNGLIISPPSLVLAVLTASMVSVIIAAKVRSGQVGHMCVEALAFEFLKTLYLEWSPPPVTVINKTWSSWPWRLHPGGGK